MNNTGRSTKEDALSLREVVYNSLRDTILRGDLKAGDRLMEIPLAEKLGVSRTPVREAIHMLEEDGLAITLPRRGAQVASMSEKDLLDVMEIRNSMDELAAVKACERITKNDIDELRKNVKDAKLAADLNDIGEVLKKDEEFHDLIYRVCNNPRLTAIIESLKKHLYRYRYEYVKNIDSCIRPLQEHCEIIAGLEKNDPEYAREIMRTHLQNEVRSIRDAIKQQEQN